MDSDITKLEQYGKELGVMLDNLDLPQSFKKALVEIIQDLPIESVEKIYLATRESLEEQVGMELNGNYQEKAVEIDENTEKELDAILEEITS